MDLQNTNDFAVIKRQNILAHNKIMQLLFRQKINNLIILVSIF